MTKLTKAQQHALALLKKRDHWWNPCTPQVAALLRKKLAWVPDVDASSGRPYALIRITDKGRAALANGEGGR